MILLRLLLCIIISTGLLQIEAFGVPPPHENKSNFIKKNNNDRRTFLKDALKLGGTTSISTLLPTSEASAKVSSNSPDAASPSTTPFSVYQIIPDAGEKLSPSVKPVEPSSFSKLISQTNWAGRNVNVKGGALWLGEHHNSKGDHNLQAELIKTIHQSRKQLNQFSSNQPATQNIESLAIGLEQVQVQFQSVLDKFVAKEISEEQMLADVQWESRWSWSYDNYRPIFTLARELNIPLVALNVNTEDLELVEEGGFPALNKEQLQRYIKDPRGFGEFARPRSFRTYSAYVIEPSYDLHQALGLLKTTRSGVVREKDMSFQNFFSGRILWDEAMAGNAFEWTKKNPGGLIIGLVGADHVKFNMGIPARYQRLVKDSRESLSVLLNPTVIDSKPYAPWNTIPGAFNPDDLALQLRYLTDDADASSQDRYLPSNTGGVLPLADYIVVNKA